LKLGLKWLLHQKQQVNNVRQKKEVTILMNIFFRVLLAIYAFCLAIVSAIAMLVTIKPVIFESIYSYLSHNVLSSRNASIGMFVIAFIFFVLSFTFLLSGFKSNKDKKAVSKYTNIGEIRISLNSIENIALNVSKKFNGVRDTKANVLKKDENVLITIRVVVMPDINIPALAEDMQSIVKKSVEESSGIAVEEVRVLVDGIFSGTGYKPRVE
jgi:uncharacterized alkaline shock family protein YloU